MAFHVDHGLISVAKRMSHHGANDHISEKMKKTFEILRLFTNEMYKNLATKFGRSHFETVQWALRWLRDFAIQIQTIDTGVNNLRGASKDENQNKMLAGIESQHFASIVPQIERKLRIVLDQLIAERDAAFEERDEGVINFREETQQPRGNGPVNAAGIRSN